MEVLLRRGNTKAIENYIGKSEELVVNTDNNSLRLMNGLTKGGKLISNIVDSNNSSSYGYVVFDNGLKIQYIRNARGSKLSPGGEWTCLTLPIKMNTITYCISIEADHGTSSLENDGAELSVGLKITSSFSARYFCRNTGTVVPSTIGISAIVVGF